MDRRDFLKSGACSALALGAAACKESVSANGSAQPEEAGRIEARQDRDHNVGLLGYGCMRWPTIKGEDGKTVIDQKSVNELVDYALAHGVNYFDSAPVYQMGQSEEYTGRALARHPRDSYYVATKASNFSNSSFDNSVLMYHKSMEYFQTDYLDYYLLHSLDGFESLNRRFIENGLIDYLMEEREKGNIRRLGFSFHGNKDGFDQLMALHDKYHWDFVQIQMNYVDWNYASGRNTDASYMYNILEQKDIPVVIMEPLLGGKLANLPAPLAARIKEKDPASTLASWAFRFNGSFPKVLTILSGMTYMEHLQDNINTFSGFQPLSQSDMAMLEEIAISLHDYPLVNCNYCNYCMPCPYGIDIVSIFRNYNNCVNEGITPSDSTQKGYKALRRRYLSSYGKAVEAERQADHCIGCGKCAKSCPQKIRIPIELQRIDKFLEKLKRDEF